MQNDELYIQRCFELARRGAGNVTPNPMVGAVIVHEGRIIGEGWHKKHGAAHAEVNAVASVKEEDVQYLSASTIYVSLEPCSFFGKTPPCVDLVLRKEFKRVVIGSTDYHPRVSGTSVKKLKDNGVEVVENVQQEKAHFLIRRSMTVHEKKRPYIILKYAQSKDGFLGDPEGQIWFTNSTSRKLVHKWRTEEAAILVGKNTAQIDNPSLTARWKKGNQPLRVVLDFDGGLNEDLRLFQDEFDTLIVSRNKNKKKETLLVETKQEIFPSLMEHLLRIRRNSLIVEGGSATLQSFIDAGLWDEARIFTVEKYLGKGIKAPQLNYIGGRESHQIGTDSLDIIYNRK